MTPVHDRLSGEQVGWWKCSLDEVTAEVCEPGETLIGREGLKLHGQPCGIAELWGRVVIFMNFGDFRHAVTHCRWFVEDQGGRRYAKQVMATPRRRRANRNAVWI